MKIVIEFDGGKKREYEIDDCIAKALAFNKVISIKIKHPDHEEFCEIRIDEP
jgi:hypothetical protein